MTKKQLKKENEELKKQAQTVKLNNEFEISKIITGTAQIIDGEKLRNRLIYIAEEFKGVYVPASLFIRKLIEWLPNAEIKIEERSDTE